MAVSSSGLIASLGAGSGVDVKALAQSLVDAEKVPRKEQIDKQIAKSEARISGYSAVSFILGELRSKFSALDDLGDLNAVSQGNSQPTAFTATSGAAAAPGSHSVEILSLAKAQRSASGGFPAKDTPINGGNALTLNLFVGGVAPESIVVPAETATPEGLVFAINASNKGVRAQLVDTGSGDNRYRIVVTGQTGREKAFTLATDDGTGQPVAGLDFSTILQASTDASLRVNGLLLTRPGNKVDDAIAGVTLDLNAVTQGEASLTLSRDTSQLKTRLKDLVAAYNDVNTVLDVAADKDSEVEGYGASLVGDSTVQRLRLQVRSIFLGDSSTPGTAVRALRDLGISVTKEGVMELDEAKLDGALTNQFEDLVKMLSNSRSTPTTLDAVPSGLAGDAVKTLSKILGVDGPLRTQTQTSESQISRHKAELEELEVRMQMLLERYNRQFGLMESFVGQTNVLRDSLKSTFEGMMAAYTKN